MTWAKDKVGFSDLHTSVITVGEERVGFHDHHDLGGGGGWVSQPLQLMQRKGSSFQTSMTLAKVRVRFPNYHILRGGENLVF